MKPHKGGRPTAADTLILEQRRQRVAAAYLAGKPQWQIAEQEKIDRSTISRDLTVLRKEWLASALQDFDARKAEELARIDRIEAAAWEAWERSRQDAEVRFVKTVKTGDGERTEATKRITGQAGDPRFLERISWCVSERCKITGIYAAVKNELAGPGGAPVPVTFIEVRRASPTGGGSDQS